MINWCTGIRKHCEMRKRIRSTPKSWITSTGRIWEQKNDELEALEHLLEKTPDKNIEGRMKKYHMNKMDTSSENFWLQEEEGWEGGETKITWDEWNRHHWGKPRLDLAHIKMIGLTWRETHRLKKNLTWQSWWSRRISTPIEIWERQLGKVWNQQLTSKQLEYHNSKQNKG